jgi:hypothetical protein
VPTFEIFWKLEQSFIKSKLNKEIHKLHQPLQSSLYGQALLKELQSSTLKASVGL